MSGACKRLFVTCVVAVLACGWSTAQANSLAAAFLPGEATTNSIWNLRVSWTQGDKDPTPKTIVLSGVGFTIPMTNPYLAPEPGQAANVTIWRLAMSRGLNMSRKEQQCKMQRVAMGEDASTVPDDDGNPCLLRDPRGNPMFYTPGLCSNDDGSVQTVSATITVTFNPPPPDSNGTVGPTPDPLILTVPAIVHSSSVPYGSSDTVDYGGKESTYGRNGNTAWIQTYPGPYWPLQGYGPDPLTAVAPSAVVASTTGATPVDDGSGSTTYDFRLKYMNIDGLPPKPWLPYEADEFDHRAEQPRVRYNPNKKTDLLARETGVVLYLDLMDIMDPLDELYPNHRADAYRPHFMRAIDPVTGDMPTSVDYRSGVTYTYRLQPTGVWQFLGSGLQSFRAPTEFQNRAYISLLLGTYHYFFGCSADHLTFDKDTQYLFDFNNSDWGSGARSSCGLDPSAPVFYDNVNGESYSRYLLAQDATGSDVPFMPRVAGRRYTIHGDVEKDDSVYVDRSDRAPGNFEDTWTQKYEYPSTLHPKISTILTGFTNLTTSGGDRFWGTISPYRRMVNPAVATVWNPEQGTQLDTRLESCGVTSTGGVTFRVKYYNIKSDPTDGGAKQPPDIRVYVNNQSFKNIDMTKLSQRLLNGGYTSYTMSPAVTQTSAGQSQTEPFDYTLGVDYQYTTSGLALGFGPHTYFFGSYDGSATAIWPARPEHWTYASWTYIDSQVPGASAGDPSGANYDNNYCPGPYVNTSCKLTQASVTPTTGVRGKKFVYRVLYSDADNQRPYSAKIEIDTDGTEAGRRTFDMIKEDPSANTYAITTDTAGNQTGGVWYVFDTSTVQISSMANGPRHYRFVFIDDWGRQSDPNDFVPGETTKLPANGDWIEGPNISANQAPRIRNGSVLSSDGTSNSATVWNFTADYFDKNNDVPTYVTVYIGQRQTDGTTIQWDSGHEMTQVDPTDTNYTDGAKFVFSTRLKGNDNPLTTSGVKVSGVTTQSVAAADKMAYLSPTLANGKPAYAPNQMIIRFASSEVAKSRAQTFTALGVQEVRPLGQANTYLVSLPSGVSVASIVPKLKSPIYANTIKDGGPNYYRYRTAIPNDTLWDKLWGLRMIHAPAAWDVTKGSSSVTVAVIDSGVSATHPDLTGRVLPGYDFADNDTDASPSATDPEAGHGTIVAGTIAAQGNNGVGVVGVCWNSVKILPLKVFPDDPTSSGASDADIIDALEYAKVHGAQVVNMSLGGPGGVAAEGDKIHELTLAGINVVVSAGNDGMAQVYYPAAFPDSIAVSALNENENLAFYSNFGPEIDIAAPGGEDLNAVDNSDTQVWSTYWTSDGGNDYGAFQGTSIAAPHVAGSLALLLSDEIAKHPSETQLQASTSVRNRLFWGARKPVSGVLVPYAYGSGVVDLAASLTATQPATPPTTGTVQLGTYYYAFEASDGNDIATWVPVDNADEDLRSESAGALKQETLTTTDNVVYHASMTPIVGTLPSTPVRPGIMVDPVVWRLPKGDASTAAIVSRIDNYVCRGSANGTIAGRTELIDPAVLPSISTVNGVFLSEDLSGINYMIGTDGSVGGFDPNTGAITLGRAVPGQNVDVWISYRHGSAYPGDYQLDRWNGTFTFVRPQDPQDVFKVDYFFTTRDLTDPTQQGSIGPVGANHAPTLTGGTVTPQVGDSLDDFTYTVIYKDVDGPNGQPPTYVRVYIDTIPFDMTPVSGGTPSFKSGVTYQYVTKLKGGNHSYYFEASDGLALVYQDANPATPLPEPIMGPWQNDSPVLTNGAAAPNPLNGTVAAQNSVTYIVTYTDPDGDAPFAGMPKVYVDNAAETETTGTVAALVVDPVDGKYRTIRVSGAPSYASGQLAGKLLQITSGSLNGRVYLIATNTTDTLKLMTDNLVNDGLTVGTTYRTGSLQMHKQTPTQQNYVAGVVYEVTAPQLSLGAHTFHFKAASTLTPPSWVTPAPVMSDLVRFPLSGEQSGPTVAIQFDPNNPNNPPVLSGVADPVVPSTGQVGDSFTFYVKYLDRDNDPPGYHNGLLGYVRVVFNDGSYTADMIPSGSGGYTTARTFSAITSTLPSGTHKFHFEASDGMDTARWPDLLAGSNPTANDPEVQVGSPSTPQAAGQTRLVAVANMAQPTLSSPVADMVSSPIVSSSGSLTDLWGVDRAILMRINIWDPTAQRYLTYGSVGFPSVVAPGTAMWILPTVDYPAEAIDPNNPPTLLSSADVLDYSKLYRLLKPIGTLYDQTTNCPISLKRGWNQIGSPYLRSTALASATVTYQAQTVSFAQAEVNGWIKGYAWMWDAEAGAANSSQGYKLVHPTLTSAASRTIDPWRGYWIKSLVDCTLTLSAP